jgi:PST family polysaccharide transporter
LINKIKSLTNTEDKRRLLSNFFSLSVLQGANYILPLITLPYLVRVLGVEYFGLLAFATATVAYFQILTDYGFNLTATREVSIHRDNKEKVIEIFSSVMTIKFMLMFVSFLLLTVLVFSFEKFSKDALVYLLTFGTVIGQVLFPVWFFQGMERMKYITYLNILSKVIFTIAIFVFVHEQSDYYLVPLLTSIGFLVAGIWSLYLVKKKFDVSFTFQKVETIKHYLVNGWDIFMQRFYVSLYTTTNLIILGVFTNNTVVGYYSIASKIIEIFRQFFTIISQVFFPYFAKKFSENQYAAFLILFKISKYMLLLSTISFILILIFGEYIVAFISGEHIYESIELLNILTIGVIIVPFFSLYTSALVSIGYSKDLNKIARNSVVISIPLSLLLIYHYEAVGLACLVVILQYYIASHYFYLLHNYYKTEIQVSKK